MLECIVIISCLTLILTGCASLIIDIWNKKSWHQKAKKVLFYARWILSAGFAISFIALLITSMK